MGEYQVRYAAFIDIIGFKQLLDRLNSDARLLTSVRDLLRKIHRPRESIDILFPESDFRATSISDAVALSGANSRLGLASVLAATELLAMDLLSLGYFVRGAIVKDLLFHDDEAVLGAALARAYHLESNIAVYPRILLPKEVMSDINAFAVGNNTPIDFSLRPRKSDDGPNFLHILRGVVPTEQGNEQQLVRATKIRNLISEKLEDATDEPAHFAKVHWFAKYWNDTMLGVPGVGLLKNRESLLPRMLID